MSVLWGYYYFYYIPCIVRWWTRKEVVDAEAPRFETFLPQPYHFYKDVGSRDIIEMKWKTQFASYLDIFTVRILRFISFSRRKLHITQRCCLVGSTYPNLLIHRTFKLAGTVFTHNLHSHFGSRHQRWDFFAQYSVCQYDSVMWGSLKEFPLLNFLQLAIRLGVF